jgi:hypothetical protein
MKQARLVFGVGSVCVGLSLASCSVILGLDGLEPRDAGADADGSARDSSDSSTSERDAPVSCNYRCTSNDDAHSVQASCGDGAWVDAGICTGKCTSSGRCLDTIASSEHPVLVALDTERIYWTDRPETGAPGSVHGCTLDGSATGILASDQSAPDGIAVDDQFVYWSDTGAGTIMTYPKDGGALSTLVSLQPGPADLLIGNGNLYWTDLVGGTVMGVPLTNPNTITTYAKTQSFPLFAAVDSENIYWTNLVGTTGLARASLDGGAPFTLAHGNPYQVAVDDTSVYWTDGMTGTLSKTAKNGDATEVILFSSAKNALALALDDGNVYWGTSDGDVVRATAEGKNSVTLASSSSGFPGNFAIDATNVYWAAGQSIERLWPK